MARPQRPVVERIAVLDAAAIVRGETCLNASDPIAAIVAARVVNEMKTYLIEDSDPFLAALGDARRKASRCPIAALATDPNVDTLALFVEARIKRLRSRSGRGLHGRADAAECDAIWHDITRALNGRYLRTIRAR